MPEAVEVEEVAVDLEAVGAEDLGVEVHPDLAGVLLEETFIFITITTKIQVEQKFCRRFALVLTRFFM